jgi:UPF0755 protein
MTTKNSKPFGRISARFWLVCLLFLTTSLAVAGWSINRWWLWAIAPPNLSNSNGSEVIARDLQIPETTSLPTPTTNTHSPQTSPQTRSQPSSQQNSHPKVRITIPLGAPLQSIGDRLEEAGVIRSSLALRLYVKLADSPAPQAGTYEFLPSQSLKEVLAQMQSGKPIESKFTIAEGWSIDQIGAYFEGEGYFKAVDFARAASQVERYKESRPWLSSSNNDITAKILIPNLEGYLFPDTYQLPPEDITPERVINLMLNRFEQVALPLYKSYEAQKVDSGIKTLVSNSEKTSEKFSEKNKRQYRSLKKLSLHEWVTLASIVEKEAVLSTERTRIAGVFSNRLRRGMRLESDPTVEYGLGIKQTVEQPLTYKQVATPNPYNTYLNTGLPPGAISGPGLASLTATINPDKTEELFFMARYDGSHIFSQTYEQHKLAISKVEKSLKP